MARPKLPTEIQAWPVALEPAARARGMRTVSGVAFVADDVYVTVLTARVVRPDARGDRLRIDWAVDSKPLVFDDLLWAAFPPLEELGPRKRLNRRVIGHITVRPLRIASGSREVDAGDEPDHAPELDAFDRARSAFIEATPTVADFVAALEREPHGLAPGVRLVREVVSLLATDRAADAARVAGDALARGEHGPISRKADVLEYLRAYAEGPEAHAAFLERLEPTHDLRVLRRTQGDLERSLSSARDAGRFDEHLSAMDGSDPWALILDRRPPADATNAFEHLAYLQAAGSAEAMVVELCSPIDPDHGIVAARAVLGRTDRDEARPDVELVLPQSTLRLGAHEVLTADEAARLFDLFYREGRLEDGYEVRLEEGFTADGESIDLRRSS